MAIAHKVAGGSRPSPCFTLSCQADRVDWGQDWMMLPANRKPFFITRGKLEDRKLQYCVISEWMDAGLKERPRDSKEMYFVFCKQ